MIEVTKGKCICGHTKGSHFLGYCSLVYKVVKAQSPKCSCPKYKLDNLKLIEDLAKERKLI
jgi:hypothetical protein